MKIIFNDSIILNGMRYHAGTPVSVTQNEIESLVKNRVRFEYMQPPITVTRTTERGAVKQTKEVSQQQQSISDKEKS